ncbi:uncharacterized protein N0V89_009210 [Didymosphaeria variabile]|uniref:Uncharacterized protein n=1 Tax=Didymosphaeria variabile TaxID=1932322 RepID=A0A9W8XDH7_9PLEO|nr:uncharacterized protein N0V89_009210 [Didymosphaeria variabile]KAJ4347840.1 hypothetical protein N0V89_009210 [Didymosphaeria variabile]
MKFTPLLILASAALTMAAPAPDPAALAKQARKGRVTASSGLNSRTCPDHKRPKDCPVIKAYPKGTVLGLFCAGRGSSVEGDTK